jgi:hypothetical protein
VLFDRTQAIIETFKQRCGLGTGLVRSFNYKNAKAEYMISIGEIALDDPDGAKHSVYFARCDEADQLVLALYSKLELGSQRTRSMGSRCFSDAKPHIRRRDKRWPQLLSAAEFRLPNFLCDLAAALPGLWLAFGCDSKNDGHINTLRLAYSTPRRWLNDGEKISVANMPTVFGEVSYFITSHLESKNCIEARCGFRSDAAPKASRFDCEFRPNPKSASERFLSTTGRIRVSMPMRRRLIFPAAPAHCRSARSALNSCLVSLCK